MLVLVSNYHYQVNPIAISGGKKAVIFVKLSFGFQLHGTQNRVIGTVFALDGNLQPLRTHQAKNVFAEKTCDCYRSNQMS